jgi:hypothetical protein
MTAGVSSSSFVRSRPEFEESYTFRAEAKNACRHASTLACVFMVVLAEVQGDLTLLSKEHKKVRFIEIRQ